MKIIRYFNQLRQNIESNPFIASFEISEDARTENEGYIKVRIYFIDSSFLDFREYLNTSEKIIKKYAYAYQYQKSDKLIFRYDNTPHHPTVRTFPNHKHIGSGEVTESPDVTLKTVLEEICRFLK